MFSFCAVVKCDIHWAAAAFYRHAELERRSRESKDALALMREAHARNLLEEKGRTSELQAKLDRLILEHERREKSHMDDLSHKDQQIQE